MPALDPLFDVEQFRALPARYAVARRLDRTTVVLGSTQRTDILSTEALAASGVAVVRRRGGGGAVLLRPGDHLWIDGGPMSLRPPCGPGPGGAERWPNMASAQASSITAGPSPDLTVRWSVSLAAVLESCS